MKARRCSLLIALLVLNLSGVVAQSNGFSHNFNGKVSFYTLFGGGTGLGVSIGMWKGFKTSQNVEVVQTALNISNLFAFGKNHLGNNGRKGTRFQWNLILSPIITTSFHWKSTKNAIYEELNSLYLNNATSIYSNYRSSFAFGTSFITIPKGFGRNYITSRNRSQQLAFFQLKAGFGEKTSVQLNLIEDVGPQFLADKWDRFFTGGGSIQVRYNYLKAKVFSEVYTGTTQRDMVDFPDLAIPIDSLERSKKKRLRDKLKQEHIYALQESGQKTYNNGRTVYALEVDDIIFRGSRSPFINRYSHNFYYYTQGGPDMWSQNVIHRLSNGDVQKVIARNPNDKTIPFKVKGNDNFLMPKHFFEPFYSNRTHGIGYGMNYIFAY